MKELNGAPGEILSTLPKGIQVERVYYHQSYTINGVTELSHSRGKGFTLIYTSEGLFGEYKGNKFIVPLSNVIVCYYA